jgi:hypothetical protein
MRGNSSAPLVVLPYTSTVLLLPRAMTVVNCRQQLSVHRNFVRTLGRFKPAAAIVLVAATLLPASAAQGQARTLRGFAHVSETFSNPFSDDDSDGAPLSTGGALIGTASLPGGSIANFNLFSATGAGTASARSAAVKFTEWPRRSSKAEASMHINDRFTFVGPIGALDAVPITVHVNWSGVLMPNADFESQYAAVFGQNTDTARVTVDMTTAWINSQGNPFGAQRFQHESATRLGVTDFNETEPIELGLNEESRTLTIDLTIGGVGFNGGGFALVGSGGIGLRASLADGAVAASSLADSFFEIVVDVPPGITISGHSAYVRQVTVPEPTAGALAPIGLLGLMVLRKRRSC